MSGPMIKHPTLSQYNPETKSSEPVMVNRHSVAERWEWDPDYRDPDFDEKAYQKDLEENWIKKDLPNGGTAYIHKGDKNE